MSNTVDQRRLTPSKITAWLDCEHYLDLQHRIEEGSLVLDNHGQGAGALAKLLQDKELAPLRPAVVVRYAAGRR